MRWRLRRLGDTGLSRLIRPEQQQVCARFGTACEPVDTDSKVGVALHTLNLQPLNALRHPAAGSTCGWYIWGGEDLPQDQEDFFQPLHVLHLPSYCPAVIPYLALPPGWRILLAPGYEDVWFDPLLLEV
ncbi:immunity protein Imm33 domain-containing protein [Geopseudomonas aromaticivorans]|uniref:immunity protein Imm33 domain-containing protein n=1 Tax=Geopseudomonas aromaticivorans TaxID=2849492 RepID=UPI003F5D4FE3